MRAIGVTDKRSSLLTVMNQQLDQHNQPIKALTRNNHVMRRLHHDFVLAVSEFPNYT